MRIVTRKTLHSRRANDSLKRTTRKLDGKAKLVARPSRKVDAKPTRRTDHTLNRHSFRNDSIMRTRRIDSLKRTSFKPTRNARNCSLKKDSEDEEVTSFIKELIKAKITAEDVIKAVKEFKSTEEEEQTEEDLNEEELDEEVESSDDEGEVKDLTPSMGDSLKSIGALAKKLSTNASVSTNEDDAWAKRMGGK